MGIGDFGSVGSAIFSFVAMALLLTASLSAPRFSGHIRYLDTFLDNTYVRFGTFGYCSTATGGCSSSQVGYHISDALRTTADGLGDATLANLAGAQILIPIAAAFAFFNFLLALASARARTASRIGIALCLDLFYGIGWLVTFVGTILTISLWALVHHKVRNLGGQSDYKAAFWLVIAALVIQTVGTVFLLCACIPDARKARNGDVVV